jgi:DNA-binding ferritin-like protein (Dps family)
MISFKLKKITKIPEKNDHDYNDFIKILFNHNVTQRFKIIIVIVMILNFIYTHLCYVSK